MRVRLTAAVLAQPVATVVTDAVKDATPAVAATKLANVLSQPFALPQWQGALPALDAVHAVVELTAAEAADAAEVSSRELEQTLRAFKREAAGRAAPGALQVLGQDAFRLVVETLALRQIARDPAAKPARTKNAARNHIGHVRAHADNTLLTSLLSSKRPDRHRAMLALLSDDVRGARAAAAQKLGRAPPKVGEVPLAPSELRAFAEVISTLDPSHGAQIRERLASGASLDDVRGLLAARLIPITAHDAHGAAPVQGADTDDRAGLRFDLNLNKWMPLDSSWRYEVRLGQLFEYQVKGVINGEDELHARLLASAIDPVSGVASVDADTIRTFLADLGACILSDNPRVRALLDQRFPLIFSTTDGGDKPKGVLWDLPTTTVADLFAAMLDGDFTRSIASDAQTNREQLAAQTAARVAPLQALLKKYPGVPRLHKRAHGALINMGLANQSVAEMGREAGVLPLSKTLLTPDILKARYADADHLKMRFLLTDDFRMLVLSDADFEAVVKKWGFPPNHELLSYNRPIAGSGYVTVDHGQIVAMEDDVVMLKGKLPDGLPPALEVLRAQGFKLDEDGIKKSANVLDFEQFKDLVAAHDLPAAPSGTAAQVSEALLTAPHLQRPALVAAVVHAALHAAAQMPGSVDVVRARAVEALVPVLQELHIINTSRKDFREGRLPRHLNESSDLHIDASLAEHLVILVEQSLAANATAGTP